MGCGNDAENSVKGRRFLPPSHGYVVIVGSCRYDKGRSGKLSCPSDVGLAGFSVGEGSRLPIIIET
jgi:hypothetical protein